MSRKKCCEYFLGIIVCYFQFIIMCYETNLDLVKRIKSCINFSRTSASPILESGDTLKDRGVVTLLTLDAVDFINPFIGVVVFGLFIDGDRGGNVDGWVSTRSDRLPYINDFIVMEVYLFVLYLYTVDDTLFCCFYCGMKWLLLLNSQWSKWI